MTAQPCFPAPGSTIPASMSASAIVMLSARLRLACDAIGCQPEDVNLDDLAPLERARLIREGEGDFWALIHS